MCLDHTMLQLYFIVRLSHQQRKIVRAVSAALESLLKFTTSQLNAIIYLCKSSRKKVRSVLLARAPHTSLREELQWNENYSPSLLFFSQVRLPRKLQFKVETIASLRLSRRREEEKLQLLRRRNEIEKSKNQSEKSQSWNEATRANCNFLYDVTENWGASGVRMKGRRSCHFVVPA